MQKTLSRSNRIVKRNNQFSDTFPKTLIVYEDVAAGKRAARLLARLFNEPIDNENFKSSINLWRYDFLEDPDWFAVALEEAVNANLVIIATNSAEGLRSSLKNWLELCLQKKRGSNAAVINVLGSAETPETGSPKIRFMETPAHQTLGGLVTESQEIRLLN